MSSSGRDGWRPNSISMRVKISAWIRPLRAMWTAMVTAWAIRAVSASAQVALAQASASTSALKRSSLKNEAMGTALVTADQSGVVDGDVIPEERKSLVCSVHPPRGWARNCRRRHFCRFSTLGSSR